MSPTTVSKIRMQRSKIPCRRRFRLLSIEAEGCPEAAARFRGFAEVPEARLRLGGIENVEVMVGSTW